MKNVKTIGLLGGMAWASSLEYYRKLNLTVADRLGGQHSAKIAMWSLDFAEVASLQHAGEWGALGRLLAAKAKLLVTAGADVMLIGSNTMHKVADEVQNAITVPLVHIVDCTAEAIRGAGAAKVGLLGTRFTMEDPFYADRFRERYGIDVIVPEVEDRNSVHEAIYGELIHGIFRDDTRSAWEGVIDRLVERGAEGIVMGCTEIPLLLKAERVKVPLYDTLDIHVRSAVQSVFQGTVHLGADRTLSE